MKSAEYTFLNKPSVALWTSEFLVSQCHPTEPSYSWVAMSAIQLRHPQPRGGDVSAMAPTSEAKEVRLKDPEGVKDP